MDGAYREATQGLDAIPDLDVAEALFNDRLKRFVEPAVRENVSKRFMRELAWKRDQRLARDMEATLAFRSRCKSKNVSPEDALAALDSPSGLKWRGKLPDALTSEQLNGLGFWQRLALAAG